MFFIALLITVVLAFWMYQEKQKRRLILAGGITLATIATILTIISAIVSILVGLYTLRNLINNNLW